MKSLAISLLIMGITFIGCNKKTQEVKENGIPDTTALVVAAVTPKFAFVASDSFKVVLGKVYEGYVEIESALAHDDFEKAKEAFNGMHAILHMVPTDGLDSSGKAYWNSLNDSIMSVLHPMAGAENIAAMRNYLVDFTPMVISALEKFGAHSKLDAYVFHCPMVRKNQGANWIQGDSVLLNPYYGKSMATCGSMVRKIDLTGT